MKELRNFIKMVWEWIQFLWARTTIPQSWTNQGKALWAGRFLVICAVMGLPLALLVTIAILYWVIF